MVYDLIIIGAGPAGAAAGIYASRQKLNVLIISKDIGGQVSKKAVDIENYPGFEKISGPDLAKIFEEQIRKNRVEIVLDEVLKIEKPAEYFIISTKSSIIYEALSVIIATGADPRPLEVEGEKEFIGKGVSYCSLCDGPVFKNKIVAVVGGGNSGFESSVFLSNYVKKIYILESGSEIKADKENQELVLKTGKAEIIKNAKVLKIKGDAFVKFLTYKDAATEKENKLDIDGVFVEIGYSPATAFVKELVDFSEKDEIITDHETYQTKTSGLFAAGDCNQGKYKQIVTAVGEGAKASLAAYEYLQKIK
ncbi:MAG: FAD-dependent oxidoreductase [Patescibacteria group bacterium]